MDVDQTAEYIGMSRSWVYDRVNTIPNFKLGNKRRFRRREVDLWLEAYRNGSPLALL
ncbi:helix-turn-helix domain-containing protein [Actinomadura madurae]|uniref:helix-turn-helix domain-containing protein n=1 Tax=Actinomadura madurae TaxID=1993 RepID=UPI00399AEDAF